MKYNITTKYCEVCGKTIDSNIKPHTKFVDCPSPAIDEYLNNLYKKMSQEVERHEED